MPSKYIIRRTIAACKKSSCEQTVAAALYKGGSVIRVCPNENKTISYRKKYFFHGEPSRHAEMNAIHGIPRDVISKCSLLVIRIDKNHNLKSAKPCIACAKALLDSGIKKVYYSSYSGHILKLDLKEVSTGNYTKELIKPNQR